MWDLVGNPEDRFSQNEAQIICIKFIAAITEPIIVKRILLTLNLSMVLFKAVPLFAPNAHIWPDDELMRLEMCAVVTPDPTFTWMTSSSSPIRYLMVCGAIQLDLSWKKKENAI